MFGNGSVLEVLETSKEESIGQKLEVSQNANNAANHVSEVLGTRMDQKLTETVDYCPKYDALAIDLVATVRDDG